VQRSIMAGDEVTGATVFSLVEELDAGPVLGTITERIRDDDTAGSLLDRLARDGAGLLVDALDHIEDGDIGAQAQPEDGVSYAGKLTTDDARVDWTRPAFAVDRQIRGCTPVPGAWTSLGDLRLKVGPVAVLAEKTLEPGRLDVGKREVRVGTATSDVRLRDVRPVGKRSMPAADWARGTTFGDSPVFT
jgi:methionyl-tRNA formyltransferase